MTIRRAGEADAHKVREIGLRTWPHAYAGILTTEQIAAGLAEWWSVDAVERSIRDGITLVAEEDREVVGMVGLGRRDDETWVMWKLYVLPSHQGRGFGHALLTAAVEALPTGTPHLWLDVLEENRAAIDFYQRHGFVSMGRRDQQSIWMRCDLNAAGRLTSSGLDGGGSAP